MNIVNTAPPDIQKVQLKDDPLNDKLNRLILVAWLLLSGETIQIAILVWAVLHCLHGR